MSDPSKSRLLTAFWGDAIRKSALDETLRVVRESFQKAKERDNVTRIRENLLRESETTAPGRVGRIGRASATMHRPTRPTDKEWILTLEARLASARVLHDRSMELIHEAAGCRRDGLAGILGWIDAAKAGQIEPVAAQIRGYQHAMMVLQNELRRESRRRATDDEPAWMDAMVILDAYAAEHISGGRARELLRFWVRGATRAELVDALPREAQENEA